MVVLLYPDISNFTFWNVKNLKCKKFLIDFLDELGNFKQKKFTFQNVNFFTIYNNAPKGSVAVKCKKKIHFEMQKFLA